MHQNSLFKPQSIVLKDYFFYHSFVYNRVSTEAFPSTSKKSPPFIRSLVVSGLNRSSFSISRESKTQNLVLIISARRNRRRTVWRKSSKAVLQCISFIASNLSLLPKALDLVIREYEGGNGGGFGFRRSLGGEGWSSRGGRKLGFIGMLLICALGLLLVLGKEFETGLDFGILGMSVLGFLTRSWKRGMKDWILGFYVCAVMVFLRFRRGELQRLVEGSIVGSPIMGIVRRMNRRGRRRRM